MLDERCETTVHLDAIFQSSSKKFQSNVLRPIKTIKTIESSTLAAIGIFKIPMKSNSAVNFLKFWNIYFFCDVINSKLSEKDPKLHNISG